MNKPMKSDVEVEKIGLKLKDLEKKGNKATVNIETLTKLIM